MRFDLSITAETGRAHVPFLRRQLKSAYALLAARSNAPGGLPLRGLSLVLVGDRRMSDLHAEFMGIAGPTDVLTFPMETDAAARVTSGEIIVCVSEARRQARIRKASPQLELLLYALHGMLHLLGYDDRTDRAFRTMHRTEDAILTELGFGPVFADSTPALATSGRSKGGRR
ncbi:MAG: rRNA maturation RNase YbeY [Tepidisphaeraceae bacterium]